MSRGPDAATLLVRALDHAMRRAGLTLVVRHADCGVGPAPPSQARGTS